MAQDRTCADPQDGERVSSVSVADTLRGIVTEKLRAADREILAVVERTVSAYEEEAARFRRQIERQRRQLEALLPRVKLERCDDLELLPPLKPVEEEEEEEGGGELKEEEDLELLPPFKPVKEEEEEDLELLPHFEPVKEEEEEDLELLSHFEPVKEEEEEDLELLPHFEPVKEEEEEDLELLSHFEPVKEEEEEDLELLPHFEPVKEEKEADGGELKEEEEQHSLTVQRNPQPPPAVPPPAAPQAEILLPETWKSTLPREQHEWVSDALFVRDETGRIALKQDLQLHYHPPGPRLVYSQPPANPDAFFQRPFFLWAPCRMWRYRLQCPVCQHTLTERGLHETVRKVLDADGWYFMATELLECRHCGKKVTAWAESIRSQLEPHHQQLFPAVLTYRLTCDLKVLAQMKGGTLGSSTSRLLSFLLEQHTEEWMRRGTRFLLTCRKFGVPGVQMPPPPPLPLMEPVPSRRQMLSVYAREAFSRIHELRAKVTSIFGSILKMGATKKVAKKLAGTDAGTAQWIVNVGNEHGQVLMSVLTVAEGHWLRDMAWGLQERYRQAGKQPPSVLYVDRDCCGRDGRTCAAGALFPEWGQMVVRLDICHFLRRLAAGVTSESHILYPEFMRRLSLCIFEWDLEDLARLKRAKQSQGSRSWTAVSVKEMARHCRRRTRGAQETERLIDEALEAFQKATATTGAPLLDSGRMANIWETQKKHLACIQDPADISLYTRIGQVTTGGEVLPVFRCARGSTSLESFHSHLDSFIPSKSASGLHFQMFLLEGLTWWNEDRARAAVEGAHSARRCYISQIQHTFDQLTQEFYGLTPVESNTKPLEYTGELIGLSYLYAQTGRVLQDFKDDPDEPDGSEDQAGEEEEEEPGETVEPVDEGFEDFMVNLDSQFSGPYKSQLPSFLLTPATSAATQENLDQDSVGPDGAPGYQHVVRLAQSLVALCVKGFITQAEVEEIVVLWEKLPDPDKTPVDNPPCHREELVLGGFKKFKKTHAPSTTACPGPDSMKQCLARQAMVSTAQWPDASRLVEAIVTQLCILHPSSKRLMGAVITRWILVLRDYNTIREVVTRHPALKARTRLQLFGVNQTTLAQWHNRKVTGQTTSSLVPTISAPVPAREPVLAAKEKMTAAPTAAVQPTIYMNLEIKEEPIPGPSGLSAAQTAAAATTITSAVASSTFSGPPAASSGHSVPKTTAWNRRNMEMRRAEAEKKGLPLRTRTQWIIRCKHCGKHKSKELGHRILKKPSGQRVDYCPVLAGGKPPGEWLASLGN